MLFNSGAEAVENAVKIARAHTGRQAVVVFDHAYHGRTNLTMALTAKNMPYKHGFGPFAPRGLPGAAVLPVPRRRVDGAEAAPPGDRPDREAGRRREPRRRRHRADPGRGRLHRARAGLPARPRRLVHARNGVVFVADEVQTGFARTGAMFACEHEGVVPDLIVTAKGIAGGLPLSAVTGRAEIMDAVARRRPRRHLRRQPAGLRRRARRRSRRSTTSDLVDRARRRSSDSMLARLRAPAGARPRASATSADAAP